MKRGAPRKVRLTEAPAMYARDRWFIKECEQFLATGILPDPEFVKEMLRRAVKSSLAEDADGPEIALALDYCAIRMIAEIPDLSMLDVVEFVSGEFFSNIGQAVPADHFDVYWFARGQSSESLLQHQKRYGLGMSDIRKKAQEYAAESDWVLELSPAEEQVLIEKLEKLAESLLGSSEAARLKKGQ